MLGKIFRKKRYNYITKDYSTCTIQKRPRASILPVVKKIVLLLSEMHLAAAFSVISNFFPEQIFWISDRAIFEMIMVFYYRKKVRVGKEWRFL